MQANRKPIILHTAVWGDWHIRMLVEVTIPTLLARGNLPHLAGQHDMAYVISTRASDRARIEAAPSYQRLTHVIPTHIATNLPEVNEGNVFNVHHVIWKGMQEQAKNTGAFVWNMPPDVAFGDNTGVTIGRLLAEGKKSIIWWYSRTADTVAEILKTQFLAPDATITVPPRKLVELSLQNLHPLANAYFIDSPNFADFHPEMLQWRIDGEGILVRMMASANWIYQPAHFKLTEQHLLDGDLNFDEIAVIDDSDDLCVLSLAPVTHNADWHEKPSRADLRSIARWWNVWPSPSNDFIAGHRIRMHAGDVTEALWHRREIESDTFVGKVRLLRDLFSIIKCALDERCIWGAAILTAASEKKLLLLRSLFPKLVKTIVFCPTDDFAKRIPTAAVSELLKPADVSRFRRFATRHVAIEDHRPGSIIDRIQRNGGLLTLKSLAGEDLVLAISPAGTISVNRIPVTGSIRLLGGHTLVPIAGCLDGDFLKEANAG